MTPLRYHRQHVARITQDQLADAIGVAKSTISRIETGDISGTYRTSPDVADAISTFFKGDVTRDQILFPQDYKPDGTKLKKTKKKRKSNGKVGH